MRTTQKEIETAFLRFCKRFDLKAATSWKDKGAYQLDHVACYGGWRIEKLLPSGGVSCPFGDRRYPAGTFAAMLRFAADAQYETQGIRFAAGASR